MKGQKRSSAPFSVRIIPAILRRLKYIGIHLEPFFTVREGENIRALNDSEGYRYAFIDEHEFDSLVAFERKEDRDTLQTWISTGKRCFAVWDDDKIIAVMWCDFEAFSFAPNHRVLGDDEVYLYAAYSDPNYRGQNIAPNMRLQCYSSLQAMGYKRFYSYTDFFNVAARRFKTKLGARNEQLRFHYRLFGLWSNTVTLRTYF